MQANSLSDDPVDGQGRLLFNSRQFARCIPDAIADDDADEDDSRA
jgi:hypothetical protein